VAVEGDGFAVINETEAERGKGVVR
jgi:hypothetical protein